MYLPDFRILTFTTSFVPTPPKKKIKLDAIVCSKYTQFGCCFLWWKLTDRFINCEKTVKSQAHNTGDQLISDNTELANSRTAGIFILDTACFHCASMNYQQMNQIRVNPTMPSYRVYRCVAKYSYTHRWRNDFQRGGANFWSQKWRVIKRRPSRLRDAAGGCLRGDVPPSKVGAFWKCNLN